MRRYELLAWPESNRRENINKMSLFSKPDEGVLIALLTRYSVPSSG
jgi:hypothetical protein